MKCHDQPKTHSEQKGALTLTLGTITNACYYYVGGGAMP